MGRKSASGSGIRDEQPGSYFLELRTHFFGFLGVNILKFFDADPGSGMETVQIRDLGSGTEKVGSGIRDKHPGSTTLWKNVFFSQKGMITVQLNHNCGPRPIPIPTTFLIPLISHYPLPYLACVGDTGPVL
jgi:hypothetical protein